MSAMRSSRYFSSFGSGCVASVYAAPSMILKTSESSNGQPLKVPCARFAASRKLASRPVSSLFSKSTFTVTTRFVSKRGSQKPALMATFVMSAALTG